MHDLCDELGLRCEVDITAGAARAWTNVKRKTDRVILHPGDTHVDGGRERERAPVN